MPTPSISTLLTYANLQMAAEALLHKPGTFLERLIIGNERTSRFTDVDAQQLIESGWVVEAHQANTTTGFSGTVFRNTLTQELVVSFRSTEFVDDAARDNQATNSMEIKPFGWAFGQIADMENWYASLTAPGGALAGRNFTVTGYSLGGHLATAFNLLHGGEGRINATYTFNGAGVGNVRPGSLLSAIVANFDRQRRNADGQQITFTDPQAQSFYLQMRARFTGGVAPTASEIEQALQVTANTQEGRLLHDAMQRIRDIVLENHRVAGLSSGSSDSPPPSVPADNAIDATRLDYQLAVLLAARNTEAIGLPANTAQAYLGTQQGPFTIPNFYDIVGATTPSAVANSQLHYGTATPVFIEDQPTWRGSVFSELAAQSAAYWDIKLLEPGYALNDFGDTHSLVLIVDSLAVQSALARLDPLVSQATLNTILQTASNASRETGTGVGSQGRADGDTLENVLDALRRLVLGPTATPTPASLGGGTWADPVFRGVFYTHLNELTSSSAFAALTGHASVRAATAIELDTLAQTDFSAIASLITLSPFVLTGNGAEGRSALETTWQTASWATAYQNWLSDYAARQLGLSAEHYTREWVQDRELLLNVVSLRNEANNSSSTVGDTSLPTDRVYNLRYADPVTGADQALVAWNPHNNGGGNALTTRPRHWIAFGGGNDDSLVGLENADHLYGGAGADSLRGLGGADWLEGQGGDDQIYGGAGNDTLLGGIGADILEGGDADDLLRGGAGSDVYHFAGTFGDDVIEDSDASGSIEVGSLGELGRNTARVSDTVWQSADGRVRYVRMPTAQANRYDLVITVAAGADAGTITVRNWSSGDLGIAMPSSNAAPGTFANTIYGDFTKEVDQSGDYYNVASRNYVNAGAAPGADDVLLGGFDRVVGTVLETPSDVLFGLGGNDGLYGAGGDDWLDGGDGSDLLFGGHGQDTLVGGAGDDIVVGSGGGWINSPVRTDFQAPAARPLEYARGFSWVVYGWQEGSRAALSFDGAGIDSFQPSDYVSRDSGNVIDAGAGRDVIFAGTGADFVSAGEGDDVVLGMHGADTISADGGNDSVYGDSPDDPSLFNHTPLSNHGNDVIAGGSGNDSLYGQGGDDRLFGGGDDDWIYGDDPDLTRTPLAYHGNDDLDGGSGSDRLFGGGLNDRLSGGAGDDRLWGDDDIDDQFDTAHHGRDTLDGGEGNDYLEGGARDDMLSGGADNDTLFGDGASSASTDFGADYLDGGAGNDFIEGEGGADTLIGGIGNDTLNGDGGAVAIAASDQAGDYLDGGEGKDELYGSGGNDVLFGGADSDVLYGGEGNDTLDGGAGVDYFDGGAGNDVYMLRLADLAQAGGYTEYLGDASGANTLVFEDVAAASLQLVRMDPGNVVFLDFGQGRGLGIRSDVLGNSSFRFTDQSFTGAQLVSRFGQGMVVSFNSEQGPVSIGGAGAQTIFASANRTTISGGAGNDTIQAEGGGNRYLYERGDGRDVLYDMSARGGVLGALGASRIVFGEGITASDINVSIGSGTLTVAIGSDGSDAIEILNINHNETLPVLPIDTLVFSDGSTFDLAARYRQGFVILANAGNDSVLGSGAADSFDGGGGNDTLRGRGGDDNLRGGLGDDSLDGGLGADLLDGGTGNDRLTGSVGADTLRGGEGDDLITGWAGNVVEGGAGNDSLDGTGTFIFGRGDGLDVLTATAATVTLRPGIRPDEVVLRQLPRNGSTRLEPQLEIGLVGSTDTLTLPGFFIGSNPLAGTLASLRFDDGTSWSAAEVVSSIFAGTDGNDDVQGSFGDDAISGQAGDDRIFGDSGRDQLDGGEGNDTIRGGSGNDTLIGGPGNDSIYDEEYANDIGDDVYVYRMGDGNDTIYGTNDRRSERHDVLRFGPGIAAEDLVLRQLSPAATGFDAFTDPFQFIVTFRHIPGSVTISGFMGYEGDSSMPIQTFEFADGSVLTAAQLRSHLLAGTDGNDFLTGAQRADVISGGLGNDTLSGNGAWEDTLLGGAGDDTYAVWSGDGSDLIEDSSGNDRIVFLTRFSTYQLLPSQARVTIESNDVILSMVGAALGQSTTTLRLVGAAISGGNSTIESIEFTDGTVWTAADLLQGPGIRGTSANDTLDGTAGADRMFGGAGNDTLRGLSGDDRLEGEDGNDSLVGGAGNDNMTGGAGNDVYVVDAVGDIVTESANDGIDTVQSAVTWTLGADVENLTLTGTTAINGTGNVLANTLIGNAAANRLDGGAGTDAMSGGAGNDTYVVDSAGDTITEAAGGGTDTVEASLTWTLAADVENLTLTGAAAINATGNTLANALRGNAGNNTLNGGFGNDTMLGGAGDDTYIVDATGDVVTENASEGTDIVQASVTWTLGSNVENLILTGTAAINATGNTLDNVLVGNTSNNTLTGGAGNDSLDGGAGTDTLIGGAGNDSYTVDATGDVVTENASEGTDTVNSSVTWTLGSNLENLTLTGTAAINATGNTLVNTLRGNAANNLLNGGTGNDTMLGGAGDDTYVVDTTGDVLTENANEGTDTVQSGVTWTLGSNLENLTLTGTTAINGTGNALDNRLTGNSANNTLTGGAGNDVLDGGTGNDTMLGGAGNDSYVVNVTTDVVTENANEGTDTVNSAVTWTLGNNLENLTLTGTSAINGTGNALANLLTGNSANNTLTSGAGNDTLDGGAGNDTMLGGAGDDSYFVNVASDVVTENANEGTDTINSAVTWTLGNNVENLALTGTAAINGTGNALANTLVGNSAANTLTGGEGADTYWGAAGNDALTDTSTTSADVYRFGRGDAQDTLRDSGGSDRLEFLSGIASDQIWLRRVGSDLEVSVIGTADRMLVNNWYGSTANRIETMRTSGGSQLLDSSVQALVNAMAAFAPPALGQTTLLPDYRSALGATITANWQPGT